MNKKEQFAQLYRENFTYVHRVCCRIMKDPDRAEELAQETFLRAWTAFGEFEARATFRTWIHRVAVNTCLMSIRRIRYPEIPLEHVDVGRTASMEADLALRLGVRELREKELVTFQLHARGLTEKEIMRELCVTSGAVKSRLNRARRKIREHAWMAPVRRVEQSKVSADR